MNNTTADINLTNNVGTDANTVFTASAYLDDDFMLPTTATNVTATVAAAVAAADHPDTVSDDAVSLHTAANDNDDDDDETESRLVIATTTAARNKIVRHEPLFTSPVPDLASESNGPRRTDDLEQPN